MKAPFNRSGTAATRPILEPVIVSSTSPGFTRVRSASALFGGLTKTASSSEMLFMRTSSERMNRAPSGT